MILFGKGVGLAPNQAKKEQVQSIAKICDFTIHTVKFWDTRYCCNQPKIQTKTPNLRVFCQNGSNGIANSEDPDQTAPLGVVSLL